METAADKRKRQKLYIVISDHERQLVKVLAATRRISIEQAYGEAVKQWIDREWQDAKGE